ncbi:MAG TPA: PAS domain-containing protein [Trichocoleus sp.]
MNEFPPDITSTALVAEDGLVLHPLVVPQVLMADPEKLSLMSAHANELEHRQWQLEITSRLTNREGEGGAAEQATQAFAYSFDHDLRYFSREGNAAADLELFGGAVVGKTLWEVFPLETSQQLEPLYRAALAGQVSVQDVIHNHRIYQVQTVPMRNPQGELFGGMACVQDITARKSAEMVLHQTAEFKQRMVESSNDCMKVLDLDGRLLYMNARGRCQMEIDNFETVRNAEWPTFWEGDDRSLAEAAVAAAKAGKVEHFQGYCPTAKGTPKWWDVVLTPIQGVDGSIVQLLSVSRDITDRKQTEAALQEQTEHTQLLYEMTRDLLSTTQPLTLIETVFKKLEALLGLDFYLNYILDEESQQLRLTFHSGFSSEVTQEIEWLEVGHPLCGTVDHQQCRIAQSDLQYSDDPKIAWLRSLGMTAYACQPLIARGKFFGTLGFGSCSRTQFTALESNLFQAICDQIAIALERSELLSSLQKQTEELMRASRIKDEFLAVLSHELRTPLSSILGWSHLLQLKQVSPERVQRGIAIIERSARQQAQLIEDLLDIARIIRGKLSLNLTKVNLGDPITAAVETVRLAAEAKSIQLKVLFDPTVKPVQGDTSRLQQVMCNLLSNAIKFTPVGGRIEVRLESDDFSAFSSQSETSYHSTQDLANQSFAQISVSDTGKGIGAEFLPYVFELFRQQDSSTTRCFGGLGLGLAIASQVVEAHGGSIAATSAGEGQGATFTVRLPIVATANSDSPALAQYQSPYLKDLRVMVVDDDVAVLELIKTFLEQEGMIVWPISSAVQALQVLTQSQFDLLISDIGMPQMDGYALIHRVRTLAPQLNRDIPAIALTAYAGENNQYQALAAGFQTHLAKPIYPQQLMNEIMTLVTQ